MVGTLSSLRWLRGLKNDKGLKIMFDHNSIGVSKFNSQLVSEHLAFDPEYETDINFFKEVIITGGELFYNLLGYKPRHCGIK